MLGQQLLRRFFTPLEVKATVGEIRTFLGLRDWLSRDVISKAAIALAKDADTTVHSIRIDGMKPDRLALLLILNVLGADLQSGRHHTYRGILGVVGTDMLNMWTAAVQTMRQRGYYDVTEAEEDMQWVRRQIEQAG